MRLAGTAMQYSTNAMAQLAKITAISGAVLYLRCPYQAMVMNRFEPINSRIGATCGLVRNDMDRPPFEGQALARFGVSRNAGDILYRPVVIVALWWGSVRGRALGAATTSLQSQHLGR